MEENLWRPNHNQNLLLKRGEEDTGTMSIIDGAFVQVRLG